MNLNYFERLKQFEHLRSPRYQMINLRLQYIEEEYKQILDTVIQTQHVRKNEKAKLTQKGTKTIPEIQN